ncbi:CYFA0S06e03862g1_1 [Cyberlindnera fabianii]|uniref:U1 small nuclear ribonucleoprotein component SNU71 n=1 Tax=Cyberlindnera fabianii TaxID=36022 RepID=A0A061AUE9_CYBFA|nr:RNA-binding protein 26 [Cyberlindnera fabianii]CDR41204.1 CYFA0S06e03862g1_1 [Cyberlindnera fabianii]
MGVFDLTEEDITQLKPWLVERSAQVSDAEPDVLADYIVALLQNKVEGEEMTKLLAGSLEDFLGGADPVAFAKEVMAGVQSKAYVKEASKPDELKKKAQEEAFKVTQEFFKKDKTSYNQAPPEYRNNIRRQPPHLQPPRLTAEQLQTQRDKESDHIHSVATDRVIRGNTVVVASLPLDKLDDSKLRSYFTRFGEITNIKLNREFRTAEIEFKEPKFARKAWSSPEPIFDNRFIKIFFKKQRPAQSEPQPFDIEEFKKQQAEKQKEFEEKQAKKKARDEQLQKMIELKEKMLTSYLAELSKLEQQLMDDPDQEASIRTQVEKIQSDMEANGVTPEAITQDKAKLEGKSMAFTSRGRYPSRGRGSLRGRGRGGRGGYAPYTKRAFAPSSRSLDLRTKTITVNLPDPNNESFQRALGVFGNDAVAGVSQKDDGHVNITFKERYQAEKFFREKIELEGLPPLEKTWDESARPSTSSTPVTGSPADAEMSTNDVEMN